ncbi:PrsW family intramembrane metalloprotease [Romboutsia sp. 1001713B170131_170501_G6]|uniref:PrsW family intramembrane metalloprotease n=1 Tax=Romboutsia sp. 1001713B170131_170501_G6 TaxID=2787108 RepID=UPI0018A96763|nr:PrsW family glutamic-type intramembrane protease [Romboutsia sp. 1001713B170131_170501_G6]
MSLNIFTLAIAPTIAYIFWIYLKDKYDKEPINRLVKFFLLGVFMGVIALIIEFILLKLNILTGYTSIIYISFIVAGMTEEGLKAFVLIPNLLKERYFNEELDGIIYSVFLSLGFATLENLLYILKEDQSTVIQVGLIRAIISVPAHMLFAITMGYYISKYKFSTDKFKKREYLILSVLIPILIHGVFDFILMIEYRWSIILFVVYVLFLGKLNLDKLDKYIINSKNRFKRRKKRIRKDDKN